MINLIGFKVSRKFPLSPRFYCIRCTETLARENGWESKNGSARKGAAPIVASTDGIVRYLRVPAAGGPLAQAGDSAAEDDPLTLAEGAVLDYLMARLGLRAVPSIPAPAEVDLRCKRCSAGVLTTPGQPLSSDALSPPPFAQAD